VLRAFKTWDTDVGISLAAGRLSKAEHLRPPETETESVALYSLALSADQPWRRTARERADLLLRAEMPHSSGLLTDLLAEGLLGRFVRWAAERGGRPIEPLPDVPDAWDARVGPLISKIPANTPTWLARHLLDSFDTRVRARIAAAEKAVKAHGRPPEADMRAWKRRGRTYFLLRLRRKPRPKVSEVGREYDRHLGRTHSTTVDKCACYNEVREDLDAAEHLLLKILPVRPS
jgi:hypothetical protein